MSLNTPYIAGFWCRLFAFILDALLISMFCGLIVSIFSNFLHQHPIISILAGYVYVILYFGLLNSHLNAGKTVAKQLLKIEVISLDGKHLSVPTSMVRAVVLFAPMCLMSLSAYFSNAIFSWGISLLLICLQALIVYFYIFNRKNRRSVHDFISKSIVINAQQIHNDPQIPSMWAKHKIFAALTVLVCLVSGISSAVSQEQNNEMTNMQLKEMQPEILHIKQISDTNFNFFDIQINRPEKLNSPFFAQQFVENLQRINPVLVDERNEVFLILRTQLQFGLVSTGQYSTYTVEQTKTGLKVVEQASSEFNQISFLSINF
ncbi:RDD family protein [Acinetobacter haemolyticus]|uniref:RDD family protein n=2 Tax=Acinetobacter TaxID=469 RepID=A0A380UNA2_ACIHA|nr:RDD family protein [Acinetobacter haemolyticus]ENW20757.1 hypothetical protein F926_01532 [Acinetobacter haemolyticus NIPH 261]NAR17862.1 RDD family protein [Acinetobacter haemolyticus]NAR47373.1 RDD family protein [Acinetobacter haemolyticus]NAR59449.1 RDD family protein [Acinetobacter haemolyticus]NAR65165.1 RDD family protein [Acinetobacter haemolyticus]